MRKRSPHLVLVAALLVLVAAACGGSSKSTSATSTKTTPTFPFKATFSATSHRPVAKSKTWFVTATVSDLSGKPIAATLQMNVLFGGGQVGQIDNGKVHSFVGHYREQVVWPKKSIGYPLTVQAVIKAKGKTKKLLWPIKVVAK
jgi:hypothetical protein